ncbi:hypothetical protein [Dialister sp.]|jgi:hypothetical protein|uniref:hypothetical protein n=1 Tax=Dialister sp. TaxID=1955814 RepID=UPI003A5C2B18
MRRRSGLPGTKLYDQMKKGECTEATEKERIQEIRTLISELNIPITINSGTSTSTVRFEVKLPEEKEKILKELDDVLDKFDVNTEIALERWRHSMLSV